MRTGRRETWETRDDSALAHLGAGGRGGLRSWGALARGTSLTLLRQPGSTLRDLASLGALTTAPRGSFKWWRRRDAAAADAWVRPRPEAFAQDGPIGFSFELSARGRLSSPGPRLIRRRRSTSTLRRRHFDRVMENYQRNDGPGRGVQLAASSPTAALSLLRTAQGQRRLRRPAPTNPWRRSPSAPAPSS